MCTNRNLSMTALGALLLSSLAGFAQETVIKGEGDKKVKVIVKENSSVMIDTVKGGSPKNVKVIVKDKTTGKDKEIVIMKRVVVNDSTNVDEVMKDIESGEKPGVAGKRKEIIIIDAGALEEAGEDIADRIEEKIDQITDKIEEKMEDVEVRVEKSRKKRVVVIEDGEEREEEKEIELRVENDTDEEVKVEERGDTTTVRLKGRKVLIIKDGDGTHVSVKKADEGEKKDKHDDNNCCEQRRAKVKTDWFGLDLGFNQYFTNNQIGEIGDDRLALNNWKSLNVTCHFVPTTFPITRSGAVNLKSAISLDMNNLRFSDKYNYLSGSDNGGLLFATSTPALSKNKLLATYAQIPLLLNFQTNPCKKDKSVSISVGGYAGMLIGSRGKRIADGDKLFVEDKFNLSPFKYGVTFRIDYKILDFYVNYNLSSLFESGKGPNTQMVAAGVNLLDF
ncbi:MAG: outer membrane beta-barrel protein [Bacteroidia bacterium]